MIIHWNAIAMRVATILLFLQKGVAKVFAVLLEPKREGARPIQQCRGDAP